MKSMRFLQILLLVSSLIFFAACSKTSSPATPLETLKAYSNAVKKNDITTMKLLLSSETLKLHEQEAKANGVTIDEIVQRDTLFPKDQKFFDFKSGNIEGDKATVDVKNSFGGWDKITLVKENGIWKINKKEFSQNTIETIETDNDELDNMIDQGRQQTENSLNDGNVNSDTGTQTGTGNTDNTNAIPIATPPAGMPNNENPNNPPPQP